MTSTQFTNPLLVASYDALNALGDDSEFFCQLVKKLSAGTIINRGCGTGLLTCELAKRGHTMIGVEPVIHSGEKVVSTDELIFRSNDEITKSLSDAGFSVKTVYGNWDSSPATPTSLEMIFVATRD